MSRDDEELDPEFVEWCSQFEDYVTEDAETVLLAIGDNDVEWTLFKRWLG
jgi:hypothetical protein